jgi:hypothetical protein
LPGATRKARPHICKYRPNDFVSLNNNTPASAGTSRPSVNNPTLSWIPPVPPGPATAYHAPTGSSYRLEIGFKAPERAKVPQYPFPRSTPLRSDSGRSGRHQPPRGCRTGVPVVSSLSALVAPTLGLAPTRHPRLAPKSNGGFNDLTGRHQPAPTFLRARPSPRTRRQTPRSSSRVTRAKSDQRVSGTIHTKGPSGVLSFHPPQAFAAAPHSTRGEVNTQSPLANHQY